MVRLEQTFFVAAHLALWFFGFVAETVLIQHPSLGCAWLGAEAFPPAPAVSTIPASPPSKQGHRRGHRHDRCSELAKGVFHTIEQCSAIKDK